jgi:hypothetical protein
MNKNNEKKSKILHSTNALRPASPIKVIHKITLKKERRKEGKKEKDGQENILK